MAFDSLEVRRNALITRLELAKSCEIMGKTAWVCLPNASYHMCTEPCVSVVITLFNYSEYIYECLDSVCASNTSGLTGGFEVLVIDDGSTDDSANMVEEYIEKSKTPICLVRKLFNTGIGDARNVGLKIARSPYVFILDADNWIYPNCLSTLYSVLNSSSYAGVYGIINKFDNYSKEGIGLLSCFEWDVRELVKGAYIDAMAMFDRNVLLNRGGYSTELIQYGWLGWEDYDMWLKLAQSNYTCKLVPQILSAYRVHPSSEINIMNQYLTSMAKYFRKKFSSLMSKYDVDIPFGIPVVDLEPEQAKFIMQPPQGGLKQDQLQISSLQMELERSLDTIRAMESSKFWKLRKAWFRLKRTVGLGQNE